ncbi:MAG TPA: hypothetical protein VMY41_03000, partial [Thermohalobaculum sp.]|nr:hypothetical protein [Thermohalobaculum sp.]
METRAELLLRHRWASCRRPPSPWTRFAEFRLASAARVALSAPEARFEPITVLLSAKLVPLR